MSLVAYGDSSESDLEAEESGRAERQASKEDIKKLLSVLPAPRKREKAGSKQPVRIGLPKLEEVRVFYRIHTPKCCHIFSCPDCSVL